MNDQLRTGRGRGIAAEETEKIRNRIVVIIQLEAQTELGRAALADLCYAKAIQSEDMLALVITVCRIEITYLNLSRELLGRRSLFPSDLIPIFKPVFAGWITTLATTILLPL